MSNRPIQTTYLPVIAAFLIIIGILIGYALGGKRTIFASNAKPSTIDEVAALIHENYVDSISYSDIQKYAIKGILEHLDPYSHLSAPNQNIKEKEKMNGFYRGIGLVVSSCQDSLYIVGVLDNSPATEGNFQPGDRLYSINGQPLTSANFNQILSNTQNQIEIQTFRNGKPIRQRLMYSYIALKNIADVKILDKNSAVVSIEHFSNTTYEDLMRCLDSLKNKHNVKNIIFDLRDNPGGYLDVAKKILDEIIEPGKLLVYTIDRNGNKLEYRSQGNPHFLFEQMSVLINEHSASSSEVFAGAIQDNKKGVIIGQTSYGKAMVQEHYDLSDGSGLRLTVAQYFTPSGQNINRSPNDSTKRGGINPNIFVRQNMAAFSEDLNDAILKYAESYWMTNHVALKNQYKTQSQFPQNLNITNDELKAQILESLKDNKSYLALLNKVNAQTNTVRLHFEYELSKFIFRNTYRYIYLDDYLTQSLRFFNEPQYRQQVMSKN
jgi:carboxyl-terminal processing protease